MCTTIKAFSSINQVALIRKKEIVAATINLHNETFIVYITFFASSNLNIQIHYFCKAYKVSLNANETLVIDTSIKTKPLYLCLNL